MNKTNQRSNRIRAVRLLCAILTLCFALALFAVGASAAEQKNEIKLIPGGIPFGVRFSTRGVVIVGFCDLEGTPKSQNPAVLAGLRPKDVITHINGRALSDAKGLLQAVEDCGGKPLQVTYNRGSEERTATLTPLFSKAEGKYKTGVWVRDSGAGIGTVTFIDPETCGFGGLGHGICDGETGELIPMERGVVTDVKISAVKKGIPGTPGEIKGYFDAEKKGTLLKNTDCGVYGLFSSLPEGLGKAIPVAGTDEIQAGPAELLCTLQDGQRRQYGIQISGINRDATGSKCFIITVTDPALIERTGGIVQGMSGSPIIQNGKLIGAVTHVLINDPCTGYGIFIENMLANIPEALG